MCRLACNVCGVTTVNGSSVGSTSSGRLSTRCSLSVISPDRPSTAGVLAFLWILHVFCLDYHQHICVSVCVGRKRQFTTSYHIFLPRSAAVFLLLHGITPTSVDGRPLCSHLPGCKYDITNRVFPCQLMKRRYKVTKLSFNRDGVHARYAVCTYRQLGI